MYISYDELRTIKKKLPKGAIHVIAKHSDLSVQEIKNFFGGNLKDPSKIVHLHRQPGPRGGIYYTDKVQVLELAKRLVSYR
jgi:hypothetical protein